MREDSASARQRDPRDGGQLLRDDARMRARSWVVTVAAGLVLADASIVTLALPELLRALDTTVEGVAAVIAVYTLVLAAALLPAERLVRRHGAAAVGAGGFALFA